ncbi:MAG: NAD kinase [Alphaproteobacteria bacterium]|nr:NAD kinase [Alphaproteobacteria bacterium]TAD90664.1 MAG: NAD kinase [Alphaproteobacteria bacterium]
MPRRRLHFTHSPAPAAAEAYNRLIERHANVPFEEAEVVVALGGDGFLLETLHRTMVTGQPVFGMNRGSVGFLLNEYWDSALIERLAEAHEVTLTPLRMIAHTIAGERVEGLAINEVSLLRETRQSAKVRIRVDGVTRLEELQGDGVLLATPAGSTAYNLSAHGPIVPLGAGVLALTPISAFRPRRWRGALLPRHSTVRFDVLEPAKRPVSAVADHLEVRDVSHVSVTEAAEVKLRLLFDPERNLEERILKEQFAP